MMEVIPQTFDGDKIILGSPYRCYLPRPVAGAEDDFNIALIPLTLLYLALVCYLYTHFWYQVKLHDGLISDTDHQILKHICIGAGTFFICTLDVRGTRIGIPFSSITHAAGIAGGCFQVQIYPWIQIAIRKIIRQMQGYSDLSFSEIMFYRLFFISGTFCGTFCAIMYILADINIIPAVLTDTALYLCYIYVDFVCGYFCISLLYIYIQIRKKDPLAARLIWNYRVLWLTAYLGVNNITFILFMWASAPEPSKVECYRDFRMQIDSTPFLAIFEQSNVTLTYWINVAGLIIVGPILMNVIEKKKLIPPISQKLFLSGVTFIFIIHFSWFIVPYIFPITVLIPFLQFMMVMVLIIGVINLFIRDSVDEYLLEDFTIAGRICHSEKKQIYGSIVAYTLFYGPWIIRVGCQSILLIGVVTSRIIPWVPESNLSLFDIYDFISINQITLLFRTIVGCTIGVYLCESCIAAFFLCTQQVHYMDKRDMIIDKLRQGHHIIRFVIYSVGTVPGIRLLLGTVQCNKGGTLDINPEIPCNGFGWHLLTVILCYNVATWIIGLGSLSFASNYLLSAPPALVDRPKSEIICSLLQCSIVILMHLVEGRIMVILAFFVIFLFWINNLRYPSTVGCASLNCLQFSITSFILHFYITALCNFDYPQQWEPFYGLVVPLPFIFSGAYFFAKWYIGISDMDRSITLRLNECMNALHEIKNGNEESITNLGTQDLGVLLHSASFRSYLYVNLTKNTQTVDAARVRTSICHIVPDQVLEQSEKSLANDKSSSDKKRDPLLALSAFYRALETQCGLLAGKNISILICLVAEYIKDNIDLEQQRYAVSICFKLRKYLLTDIRKHSGDAIIKLWAKTKDKEIHHICNHVIKTIIGNDRIILYPAGNRDGPTILHKQIYKDDKDGIIKLQIVGRCIWFIPVQKNDNESSSIGCSSNIFTSDDCIDATLSLSPTIGIPGSIYQKICKPRLYINTDPTFTEFSTFDEKEEVIENVKSKGVDDEKEVNNFKTMCIPNTIDTDDIEDRPLGTTILHNFGASEKIGKSKKIQVEENEIKRFLLGTLEIPNLENENDLYTDYRHMLTQYYKGILKKITEEE